MNAKVPRWVRWLPGKRLGFMSLLLHVLLSGAVYVYEGLDRSWAWGVAVLRNGLVLEVLELNAPADYEALHSRETTAPKEAYRLWVSKAGRPSVPFVCHARTAQAAISIKYASLAGLPSKTECDEVQAAVAKWSTAAPDRMYVPMPAVADEVVPSRVAWNVAMAALVLVAPLAIVRFVYETRAAARERVWIERLQRGVCPKCEYSIAGLQRESCPECGENIPRDAIAAATDADRKLVALPGEEHRHEDVSVARGAEQTSGDRRATQSGDAGPGEGA